MTNRYFKKIINRYMRALRRWTVAFDCSGKGGPAEERKWNALQAARHHVMLLPKNY